MKKPFLFILAVVGILIALAWRKNSLFRVADGKLVAANNGVTTPTMAVNERNDFRRPQRERV